MGKIERAMSLKESLAFSLPSLRLHITVSKTGMKECAITHPEAQSEYRLHHSYICLSNLLVTTTPSYTCMLFSLCSKVYPPDLPLYQVL